MMHACMDRVVDNLVGSEGGINQQLTVFQVIGIGVFSKVRFPDDDTDHCDIQIL